MALRFVREGVTVGAASRDELPGRACVLVVDDAHRRDDIEALCAIARYSPYPIKLLLATRPHAVNYLRSVLTYAGCDAREVLRLDSLSNLCREDVKKLAGQALGDDHADLAERLARATKDCPLVTVVGGRLLAERAIQPAELENDDEFRAVVLDRFRDILLGDLGDDIDATFCRSLLPLIAAIAPFRPDDGRFLSTMAEHLGTDQPRLVSTLGALEEAGVLMRRGHALRLVPDVLADHILHRACLTSTGQATGFAQDVFDRFTSICPDAVLANLAELDWRVRRASGHDTTVLDNIWRSIKESFRASSHWDRCLILGLLMKVAYHQPKRVLQVVDMAMRYPAGDDADATANVLWGFEYTHDHVLYRLPELLRGAGYTLEYLPRCCDLLWRLGRDDGRPTGPNPDHAMRVLDDIAGYDIEKPLRVNEIVLEAVERWLRASDVHRHAHSPLDVLDPLLAKASASHHAEGHAFIIRPFLVHRDNTRPLRARAMLIIAECARSTDLAVALRAIKSADTALANPMPYFNQPISDEDIEGWVPEQVATLDMVARIARDATHPLIHLAIGKALAWHARNGAREEIRLKARAIIAAIPDSFELRLAKALIPNHNEWLLDNIEDVTEAYKRGQRRREDAIRAVAIEFLELYSDASTGADALDERLDWGVILGERKVPAPESLLIELARQQPKYAVRLCELILVSPDRPIARHLPTLLSCVRVTDPKRAVDMAHRAATSGQTNLARSIAWLYRYCDQLLPGDIPILTDLLGHLDTEVKSEAIAAVHKIAPEQPRKAIELVRKIDIDGNVELAKAVCWVLTLQNGDTLPLLDESDALDILLKLEPVRSIDGFHVGQFIAGVAKRWPRHVVRVFLRRIIRDDYSDPSYEPFPHDGLQVGLDGVAESDAYEDILRDIRDAALGCRSDVDASLSRLYRQASRVYDEHGLSVLGEWIENGSADHLIAISELLRTAPWSFIFDHEDFLARLLEQADEVGGSCCAVVTSVFYGVAKGGARMRSPGQPFPEDIELRTKASEAAARWASSWPVRDFYAALAADATQAIEDARIEDDAIDEA